MKREEKNEQSRKKILESALREFGKKSYSETSMNDICGAGGISKGNLYHYFKDKDELYLTCVGICFDKMTEYMGERMAKKDTAEGILAEYMRVRQIFFREYPEYQNLFFGALFQCPEHLKREVREREKEFQRFNIEHFRRVLSCVKLREGITEEQAVEYFCMFQEMFNGYCSIHAQEDGELGRQALFHENRLSDIVEVLLYGVTEKK